MKLKLARQILPLVLVATGAILPLSSFAQDAGTNPVVATNAVSPFDQAVADYQKKPADDAAAKVIKLAVTMNALPPIPEEARKHFIMAATMFTNATDVAERAQAAGEFDQAVKLAPWWPDARYDLAMVKEAAGDFPGAMADLKLYQAFKLSETEARTVQDKIYVLEAKQQKDANAKATVLAEEQKKKEYQRNIGFLEGEWKVESFQRARSFRNSTAVKITLNGDKIQIIAIHLPSLRDHFQNEESEPPFFVKGGEGYKIRGKIIGSDYNSIRWFLSCSVCIIDGDPCSGLKWPEIPISINIDMPNTRLTFTVPGARFAKGWTEGTWNNEAGDDIIDFTLTKQ